MSQSFWVNGIVAHRDKLPYIQLSNENGLICQLSMAEARNVAADIVQMCARTEADAMIYRFFTEVEDAPSELPGIVMLKFRDFRAALDAEKVERRQSDPDTGEDKGSL